MLHLDIEILADDYEEMMEAFQDVAPEADAWREVDWALRNGWERTEDTCCNGFPILAEDAGRYAAATRYMPEERLTHYKCFKCEDEWTE